MSRFSFSPKFISSIYKEIEMKGLDDYLLELYIPCIKLREFVYDINSKKNNVDFHVEILGSSDLEKNVYFLAGHSGSGSNSYFNDLILVEVGEIVYITRDGYQYSFVVEDSYYIIKNGYLEVDANVSNVLFLITCSLEYPEKQLILRAKLL